MIQENLQPLTNNDLYLGVQIPFKAVPHYKGAKVSQKLCGLAIV